MRTLIMSEEDQLIPEDTKIPSKNWLERIGQVFSGEPQSRIELIELLREATQRGLLDNDALTMIEGVLQVSERRVRDIMVPRSQMVVVDTQQTPEQLLPIIIQSGHSRFPVINNTKDEIIGILLAKDLLRYAFNGHGNGDHFDIRDLMRPAVFIPESKRLNVLLKEFRAKHNHMAIIADEYGGVAGLVTIEDVLEEIVGEIEDEYDIEADAQIKPLTDTSYAIKALTPIEQFNQFFNTQFDTEEFDTVGGLITKAFGHVPKRGENIVIDYFEFKVLKADSRRVRLLQAKRIKPAE